MTDFDPMTDPDASRPGCEPGQSALQRLLDGEPAWDSPDAVAHRATCLDCREDLTLARSLTGFATAVIVPHELADRVLAASVGAHRFRRRVRHVGIGLAMAASVLIAIFVFQPTPQTVSEGRTVAIVTPKADAVVSRPLGESVSEARDAIVSLTRRTASETRETSSGLMPNPKLTDMPDTGDGLEPLADARSGAARSVEPLRASARRAVNLFLRAADPPNRPAVP